jgi:hypothetical protein
MHVTMINLRTRQRFGALDQAAGRVHARFKAVRSPGDNGSIKGGIVNPKPPLPDNYQHLQQLQR